MNLVVPENFTITVQFEDGKTGQINLFQMETMIKAIEFRVKTGYWPPSMNKLRLTRKRIAERFFIDPQYAKTYKMLAETMRECHDDMMAQFKAAQTSNQKDK